MNSYVEKTRMSEQRKARIAAEYAYNNRRWTYDDLWDAYERPSMDKVRAWRHCLDLCASLGGYDILIASRNTFSFSVVFAFDDDDGRMCYAYITRDYERFCYAEEAEQAA